MLDKELSFYKYEGAGNDFILIEPAHGPIAPGAWVTQLCKRHHGIGADGILQCFAVAPDHWRMLIYNADGTRASMCGNGLRCCAAHLWKSGKQQGSFYLQSDAGMHWMQYHTPEVTDASSNVYWSISCFGRPKTSQLDIQSQLDLTLTASLLDPSLIDHVDFINTGVEHLIFTCTHLPAMFDLKAFGKFWRWHSHFNPKGTNVSIVTHSLSHELHMSTFERGVEAPTRACGTGACAAAASYFLRSGLKSVRVKFPQEPSFNITQDDEGALWLTGPARFIYEGRISLADMDGLTYLPFGKL